MPPSAPTLRPYQRDAVEAVLAARRAGVRRMVVCLPTGAGKTVVFAHLATLARRQVLVLAHREELVTQARDKIARALEGSGVVAIEQGSQRAPAGAKVLVASIRSLHRTVTAVSRRAFGSTGSMSRACLTASERGSGHAPWGSCSSRSTWCRR